MGHPRPTRVCTSFSEQKKGLREPRPPELTTSTAVGGETCSARRQSIWGAVLEAWRPRTEICARGGEIDEAADLPVQPTQGQFTEAPNPIPITSGLQASRQRPLSMEGIRSCRRKIARLRRLATPLRSDVSARLTKMATKVDSLQGSGIYRINNHIKTAKGWQGATIPKNENEYVKLEEL